MKKIIESEGGNVTDYPFVSILHPDRSFCLALSLCLSPLGYQTKNEHNPPSFPPIDTSQGFEQVNKVDIVVAMLFPEDLTWILENPSFSVHEERSQAIPPFMATVHSYQGACQSRTEKAGNLIFILPYHLYSGISQSLLDNVERGLYNAFLPSLALQLAPSIRINTLLLPPTENNSPLQNDPALGFQSIAQTIHFVYQCQAITGTLLPISYKI